MISMTREDKFISCDWGTTAFRLRLIDSRDFSILAEVKQKDGNASMDKAFRDSGGSDRLKYYLDYLEQQYAALARETDISLKGAPILISGMSSSTIGMKELAYKALPYRLDGSDLKMEEVGTIGADNAVVLISGVCSSDDVMRGEEVQVVGCGIERAPELQIMLHPGTHAKHIMIRDGEVVDFHTYMTGELFALLSEKSILAGSVKKPDGNDEDAAFQEGVRTGHASNIVHSLFLVRTNRLFDKHSPEANFRFLSGLLIGHELRAVPEDFSGKLYLAGDKALVREYRLALDTLDISARVGLIVRDGDEVTFRGQHMVYSSQMNRY